MINSKRNQFVILWAQNSASKPIVHWQLVDPSLMNKMASILDPSMVPSNPIANDLLVYRPIDD